MQVTANAPVETYVIAGITVDMNTPSIGVSFSHQFDGRELERVSFSLTGEAFATTFATVGNGPRGEDLARVLYQAALDANVIRGALA